MTAQTAAATRQQRGAFVDAFMVVAGTAIPSDLLKKIEETDLLKKENQEFKNLFKVNLTYFCGRKSDPKYLKFCLY